MRTLTREEAYDVIHEVVNKMEPCPFWVIRRGMMRYARQFPANLQYLVASMVCNGSLKRLGVEGSRFYLYCTGEI